MNLPAVLFIYGCGLSRQCQLTFKQPRKAAHYGLTVMKAALSEHKISDTLALFCLYRRKSVVVPVVNCGGAVSSLNSLPSGGIVLEIGGF